MAQDATHKTKIMFALRRKKNQKHKRGVISSGLRWSFFFLREGGGIKELAMLGQGNREDGGRLHKTKEKPTVQTQFFWFSALASNFWSL